MVSLPRLKRKDVQKKFYELKDKLKKTLETIDQLEKGLETQKRIKAEYEGAITTLYEILTGKSTK